MLSTALSTAVVGALATTAFIATPANAAHPRKTQPANPTTIGASCSTPGETGQTVKVVRTYFDGSAGTWTVSNYNDEPIPVTRSVTETKTRNWNVSAGVDFPLLDVIHISISASYSSSQSFQVGETIGPYNLAPGKTAVLQAGWLVSDFEGEHTVCGADHTWQGKGDHFTATLPKERHVAISTRDNDQLGA
ncbi:MAG: hypothetical protein E6777_08240 [Propionibacterium sp.]|nr:hypothetical protein [Propionibacterium sp.]